MHLPACSQPMQITGFRPLRFNVTAKLSWNTAGGLVWFERLTGKAPLQAPAANPSGRTFRVATPCYRRVSGRKTQLILGDKPDPLKHLDRIDQTIWEQYQVHLKRTTPLERARFYARQMEARGLKSTAALERALGEPFHRVWRALRLLELPEPVQRYLEEHRTPDMVRYFAERKLLTLLKLRDPRAIWRRFQEMLAEARREAGVWSQPGDVPSAASP